jgi:hypothetical protein
MDHLHLWSFVGIVGGDHLPTGNSGLGEEFCLPRGVRVSGATTSLDKTEMNVISVDLSQ